MNKKRFLSSMTVVGYGMLAVFVVLFIAIAIFLSINGFGKVEKKVDKIAFSMPENSAEVTTENDVTSISTTDIYKTIDFKIAGVAGNEEVDYSTRTITVVINNSSGTEFTPASKEATSVWFVQRNGSGELLQDEEGNYIPVDSNKIDVKVNDPITLMLATTKYEDNDLNPDKDASYLKGGISYIHARSGDNLLDADEIKVQVDVPVENFEIVVYGYDYNDTTNQKIDLTDSIKKTSGISYKNIRKITNEGDEYLNISDTTQNHLGKTIYFVGESTSKYEKGKYYTVVEKENNTIGWQENNSLRYFIQGTQLDLGVRTFPQNATSPILGKFKQAMFSLEAVSSDSAVISGSELSVVGADAATTGSIKIVATLPILLGGTERVASEIVVETAAYEIEKLEYDNNQIKDNTINCFLNKQMNVNFNSIEQDDGLSLGISIIPKFYNGHNNPYENDFTSIYAELRSNHGVADEGAGTISVSSLAEGFVEPISSFSTRNVTNGTKTTNKIASFTASRMLFSDENIYLIISNQQSFSDTNLPYLAFKVVSIINKPVTNQQNEELNELTYNAELTINFAKEDENYIYFAGKKYDEEVLINNEKIIEEGILSSNNSNELKIDYTKETERPIIYTSTDQSLFAKWVFFAQTRVSDVISLSSTGQIKTPTTYGSQVYAIGQGNINIYPKLVLCNQDYEPINCFYETFAVNDETGYLLIDEIKSTDLIESNKNNYVVLYDPQISEKIVVTEKLVELSFFYDQTLKDKIEGDIEIVAQSRKDFYLIANSKAALQNSKPGSRLQATLTMSASQQNLRLFYDTNYLYASFSVEDKPEDDDCLLEFSIDENPLSSIKAQIKLVDIQAIDAVFDVVQELNTHLLSKDLNRRVLYEGENATFNNTDGTQLLLIRGKYYIVDSKEIDGATVYYWKADSENPALGYSNDVKHISIAETSTSTQISFDSNGLTLPNSVYSTLTVKQEHGYEDLDVRGKTVGYRVVVIDNASKVINKNDIVTLTQNNLAQHIKVNTYNDAFKFALYDGWKSEINGKYVYLVYTMSVNQVLKAVDSYRIDFDLTENDYSISLKSQVTIEGSTYNVDGLYAEKDESDYTTNIIKLNSSMGQLLGDVRALLNVANNKNGTNSDYNDNYSGLSLRGILMSNNPNIEEVDYSVYVSVIFGETGQLTLSAIDGYKFTTENEENPLAQSGQYKITLQCFIDVENSNAFYAINIPLIIGFNVVNA